MSIEEDNIITFKKKSEKDDDKPVYMNAAVFVTDKEIGIQIGNEAVLLPLEAALKLIVVLMIAYKMKAQELGEKT